MVIYFLEYRTKELILPWACKKKKENHSNGKRVFFDQDYPKEVKGVYSYQKNAKRKGAPVPDTPAVKVPGLL